MPELFRDDIHTATFEDAVSPSVGAQCEHIPLLFPCTRCLSPVFRLLDCAGKTVYGPVSVLLLARANPKANHPTQTERHYAKTTLCLTSAQSAACDRRITALRNVRQSQ